MAENGKQEMSAPKAGVPGPSTAALREESAPKELTGRAAATDDDLTALFGSTARDHLSDGFSGGSDDDTGVATRKDGGADAPASSPRSQPE